MYCRRSPNQHISPQQACSTASLRHYHWIRTRFDRMDSCDETDSRAQLEPKTLLGLVLPSTVVGLWSGIYCTQCRLVVIFRFPVFGQNRGYDTQRLNFAFQPRPFNLFLSQNCINVSHAQAPLRMAWELHGATIRSAIEAWLLDWCQKANSDSTSWTTTEKWLNREVGLDDGTGFTRRQCTTMRKLCRPSGGFNTHVLGLFPSHSEYRTRSLIVLCSIIYPLARWLFFLSSCATDASLTRMPNQVLSASLTIPRLLAPSSSIQSVPVSLSLRRG